MFKLTLIAPLLGLASASLWGKTPGYGVPEWPVSDVGSPLKPQTPDAELKAMLAEIDPKRIENTVRTLAGFGTRHTLSTQTDPNRGIGAARDWIESQMRDYAQGNENSSVYLNSYIQGVAERVSFPVNVSNVVTEIKGCSDPDRVYVVTGHYDSRRIDVMDYTGDAPGADDDASGVSGESIAIMSSLAHWK